MALTVFMVALGLILYSYFGYPVLLWILTVGKRKARTRLPSELPTVSVIITAHDEQEVIEEKIQNSLNLNYPKDKLEIIVASDGSTDGTNAIVRRYQDKGVILLALSERVGKTVAQNEAVKVARGDLLVFSDANGIYDQNAVLELIRPFSDPAVGCVSGELQYSNPEGTGAGRGESLYWRYEQFLKRKESLLGSLLGANGSIYAVRRRLFAPLDPDIISDFILPLQVYKMGYQVKYEPRAMSMEQSCVQFSDEFKRRKRIVARSLRGLASERDLLNPFKYGIFAFQMTSHKLLRWGVPLLLAAMFISNGFLLGEGPYALFFGLQLAFYGLGIVGSLFASRLNVAGVFYIPAYFCLMNLGVLAGIASYLKGGAPVTWESVR